MCLQYIGFHLYCFPFCHLLTMMWHYPNICPRRKCNMSSLLSKKKGIFINLLCTTVLDCPLAALYCEDVVAEAAFLGSNSASSTMILMRCRIIVQYCKSQGIESDTFPEAKKKKKKYCTVDNKNTFLEATG